MMRNTIEAEAALENCRALIDQITAGLSAEEPFGMFHQRPSFCCILSLPLLLSKSSPREREETKIALNYRWC